MSNEEVGTAYSSDSSGSYSDASDTDSDNDSDTDSDDTDSDSSSISDEYSNLGDDVDNFQKRTKDNEDDWAGKRYNGTFPPDYVPGACFYNQLTNHYIDEYLREWPSLVYKRARNVRLHQAQLEKLAADTEAVRPPPKKTKEKKKKKKKRVEGVSAPSRKLPGRASKNQARKNITNQVHNRTHLFLQILVFELILMLELHLILPICCFIYTYHRRTMPKNPMTMLTLTCK